ncbi:hypothetical protein CLHUN_12950 [Ruminiclostridium hungatei]|uniref:DUF6998 domain-containing protein n=1 Tax=Ruminiclostridium hungatei TaxID=48256 RepID=A0A1V4SMN2_RUMHU|nr:hypothetical protein [Ruminiclostridium hungatei]OPX45063.1 hypothetical protein CLHUN_12950 [Ruminiclostridium hungatei]
MNNNESKIYAIPDKIKELYKIVDFLEESFPGRPFTPDGHLVGSIGEVLAEFYYGLKLLPPSFETHDATTVDGRLVQIKATQGRSIGLRGNPEYLLVIKILSTGAIEEIYSGPGSIVWEAAGKLQNNGQRNISTNKLKELFKKVPIEKQLQRIK